MLTLRTNEKAYVLEFRTPADSNRHALVLRDPESKKLVANLQWDADTHVIGWIRVGNTNAEAKALRRRGVATAMLATARTRDPKIRHSQSRTNDGEAWARSLGERLPKRRGETKTI